MKIYRNHYISELVGSEGSSFHASKREAKRAAAERGFDKRSMRENAGVDDRCDTSVINVKPTRAEIVRLLNDYAAHPDNG